MMSWIRVGGLLALTAVLLSGCGGGEDRKAEYLQKAKDFLIAENYDKARVEVKNVLQIDPKSAEGHYLMGRVLEHQRDFRQAFAHFKKAEELDPTHAEAVSRVGRYYLLANEPDKATEMADRLLAADPASLDGKILKASISAKAGDYAEAIKQAEAVVAADPGRDEAVTLLASLHNKQGDLDAVRGVLEKGVESSPDSVALRLLLAQTYLRGGEKEKAEAQLKKNVELQPENLGHRVRLAALYSNLQRLDDGEQVLRDGIAANPEDAAAKLALTEFLATRRTGNQAEKELLGFIEADPEAHPLRLGLARLYEASNQRDKAKAVYRKIIEMDGTGLNGLSARSRLGALLAAEKKFDEATALADEVLKENPRDNDALLVRAAVSLAKNDPAGAIADYRTILKDRPKSSKVLRNLAKAHLINKEPELAMESMKQAVESNPRDLDARQDLAALLVKSGDAEGGIAQLRQIISLSPKHSKALQTLIALQIARRDWAGATDTAGQIKAAFPDQGAGYYFMGLIYQGQKEFEQSIAELSTALEKQPKSAEALTAIVRSYLALNKSDEALARLDTALETMADNPVAQNLKGEVLIFRKEYGAAEAPLIKAGELNSKWPIPFRNLAGARLAAGNSEGAVEAFKHGIQATGGAPVLVFGLASVYQREDKADEAIELYEEFLKRNPTADAAINNLAMLLVERGSEADSKRAGELAERLKINPNPAFMDTAGWVHFKRKEFEKAMPLLEQAVEQAPNQPVFQYHLGMAQKAQGKVELARKNLEKALEPGVKFDGMEEAKAALKELSKS